MVSQLRWFRDTALLRTFNLTPLALKVSTSKGKAKSPQGTPKLPADVIHLVRIDVLGAVRFVRTADPDGLEGSKTLTRWRVTR